MCLGLWLPVTLAFRYQIWFCTWSMPLKILANFIFFIAWDDCMVWFAVCAVYLERVLSRKECTNRLFNRAEGTEEYKGSRIVILGNGPSLASGDPLGAAIDSMDEVVRFNNFQTRLSGLEAWTGTKTTVHFSDSMLYPSYPEYQVTGACEVLSLFMDRLVVGGSYFIFRMAIDLAPAEALELMLKPALGWIPGEDIARLKKHLNISSWKHPTSGLLAIDWFVRHRPDTEVPIYIHGFDFFQGSSVHYYSKTEPLYEHLNDLLGVNMMHEPSKERAFVDALVKEGKVKWLKDAVADGDTGDKVKAAVSQAAEEAVRKAASVDAEASKARADSSKGLWSWVVATNRACTALSYPICVPFVCLDFSPSSAEKAQFYGCAMLGVWLPLACIFHSCISSVLLRFSSRCLSHFLFFWSVDVPCFWATLCLFGVARVLSRKKCTNRLFGTEKPKFKGSKITILGNGPSLAKGTPHGELIDSMDEVVRFNNFQTKTSGLEAWTGSKTTVHFSDSMLYPSFPEYEVPGACVCLSLFMDRLMISLSYLMFRTAVDLAGCRAWGVVGSPAVGWPSTADIHGLKQELDIGKWKHPTSGCLAIDWFVRHRPDPDVPVYIHGFDFFQGDELHYYTKTEPLYERLNDVLGVTLMHEPHKERAFVDRLVKEGKVKWVEDLAGEMDGKAAKST